MNRIDVWKRTGHQGVTDFVPGDSLFDFFRHDAGCFFQPGDDSFESFLEFVLSDCRFVVASRQQCSFIHKVCQIRTNEPCGQLGDVLEIDGIVHLHLGSMHIQNRFASLDVRPVDKDMTIKTTGSH